MRESMKDRVGKKRCRLEVNNPKLYGTPDWQALWGFDEDQYTAYQLLIGELNLINAPVQLRIVRHSDLDSQNESLGVGI